MSLVWPILAHLSAEPLVGLKLPDFGDLSESEQLSAEPLVGLKRCREHEKRTHGRPFSRTPRGFEALRVNTVVPTPYTFSRTPRGFEASNTTQPK